MYLLKIWTTLSLICIQVGATPFHVMESLPTTPPGWTKVGSALPHEKIRLHVSMEHFNQKQFEQTLLEVSDPYHLRYGKHLSREELKAILRPKIESTDIVMSWLQEGGAVDIEDDGEWIHFSCTMKQAEELLNTKYVQYRHDSGVLSTRALGYSVPRNVKQHIRMIHPTTRFGQPIPAAERFQVVSNAAEIPAVKMLAANPTAIPSGPLNATFCNGTITPECLRSLYSIGDYKPTPGVNSILGVTGYLKEVPKFEDMDQFFQKYAPYAIGSNFSYVTIDGGTLNQTRDLKIDDVEANLDMQYTMPFVMNTTTIFYSTGGLAPWQASLNFPTIEDAGNEPYLTWLNYMSKVPTEQLPQTITTSYNEDEQAIPEAYTRTVCDMLGQLGARGVSIIFASGDNGPGTGCQANFGNLTGKPRFLAGFPATCPWVTAVGGTEFVQPEKAVNISGGGFSERFARPSYQDADVTSYLKTVGKTFDGLYNPNGRAIPDISGQARNFALFGTSHETGISKEGKIGGTSAAAPVVAGIVSLMNNARLANNQPPMGFLNPWLYSIGRAGLTDIVEGRSIGCEAKSKLSGLTSPEIPNAGWNATQGWDAATGLGTPNFGKLLNLSTPSAATKHIAAGGNFGV